MNRVRKEELGNGAWVYTAPFCPVMTDSLLLASFSARCAAPSSGKKKICAVDLGTGCGILPFLWSKNPRFASILGIELQQETCCLAQKAAKSRGCRVACSLFARTCGSPTKAYSGNHLTWWPAIRLIFREVAEMSAPTRCGPLPGRRQPARWKKLRRQLFRSFGLAAYFVFVIGRNGCATCCR